MNDIQVKSIDDIEAYSGPSEIPGIRFRPARAALSVTAWGMNVLDLDPGCTGYPEHDHEKDGQEEVYVIMRGEATLHAGNHTTTVRQGDMIRVGPRVKRKFVTTDQSVRILALGATPGAVFEPKM